MSEMSKSEASPASTTSRWTDSVHDVSANAVSKSKELCNASPAESTIPDPTSDLGWSDYLGAIQDIFTANAKTFPERICIEETPSESAPQRIFSYGQINEASNLLGHHLVNSGVVRGDVVMVYAYRGVDLVVAVMGVLKAGATFSVIDPAYPPERQKIYLEVAQPRALVNIHKATIEAGHLSQLVRDYIDNDLQLKTEVPALRIGDDGRLSGGFRDGQDILDWQRGSATMSPGVLVGPDSNPTLSFTSGSEGRPKGVLGRHFSLAYYFPWMARRFGLSDRDRFTMLSGIAHDPIQRDIFTPLFLGARLLVPAKEDIQHERLAEWMQTHRATVTHLTPAMGQILVGGASAEFPTLKRAFFVGDLLTKRDCKLLQQLATNVAIVNMYGTTETQRAVSFFEIPSYTEDPKFLDQMKDIMPAGQGMHNVQLIVVDQTDRTKQCEIGQVGEIYVRAGGLAEGYLGDEAKNKEKFVENWFVDPRKWMKEAQERSSNEGVREEPWRKLYKGPRDRLYRTGDLGRYTSSGDVECTGRADDQVKIRGFRIELGEINSHLSGHKLIRDCITLVRRNKDEEPTLVSYVVPELKEWPAWLASKHLQDQPQVDSMAGMLRRFRPLQDEVRSHLKEKLPSYAIPSHFIPLSKLPLNPNGKVDKPALPFPDIADINAVTQEGNEENWTSLSESERKIASMWAGLIPHCNERTIRPTDSFFDLGGHSILAQQMLLITKKRLDVRISMGSLFQDPTLRGFSRELDRALNPQANFTGADGVFHQSNGHIETEDYAADARRMVNELSPSFAASSILNSSQPVTVFLTGASGYLGTYLLRDLLSRTSPSVNVVAHVRAQSPEKAIERLKQSCTAYGVWSQEWLTRLSCVTGTLGHDKLGLELGVWEDLAERIDLIIHNGAQVHWVYPYSKLKAPNVQGTIDALRLCASGRPKSFAFISSTSVLDTEHYVRLSEDSIRAGGTGVSESDDLEGSSTGLATGYGQSKWVSEYLVKEAGRRGLTGSIIRPGYVLGDSQSGGEQHIPLYYRLI